MCTQCFIIVTLELSKRANSLQSEDLEEEHAPTTREISAPPSPKTAKQLAARRNQERVKSILLLAIPDEYLLKFHNVADAKSLWEAIKSRFGDKAYDRFQKLISQFEVHGAPISMEDINQKFLRSLPPSWNQIALIMRNKPDIEEIDIDDLYNNLRVYEDEMKRSSSSTSNSQNLAFLSFENTNSTNEVGTASGDLGIDEDDLEELDLRWQVAMLTVRVKKSGRNQGRRSYGENGRSNAPTNESSSQVLVAQDGLGGYDWSNDFEVEPVNYALHQVLLTMSLRSVSIDKEIIEGLELRCDEDNVSEVQTVNPGNPEILLQDHAVVDSVSALSKDCQQSLSFRIIKYNNEGFLAFRSDPQESKRMRIFFHTDPPVPRYGYIKNHKKTVKNGQTRTQERKSVRKPEAKVKALEFPKFNKWLSSLLRNKEKLEEIAITTVNAKCSAIIMNKVPEKLKDLGKFLIPCALQELDSLTIF
ncbi:hypothetical protein Tco_0267272 [Tanacetum coccineum]